MKKITLDSSFLKSVYIDTYHTFDSRSYEESEINWHNEEYNCEESWDYFEFNYNHEGVVKDLAGVAIRYMIEELDIIKDIELVSVYSPRYYNYSSDTFNATYEVDMDKLNKYCKDNEDSFDEFVRECTTPRDGFIPYNDYCDAIEDDRFKLAYYMNNEVEQDDYVLYVFEHLDEIYSNNRI